jgi:fimbrial chaperone protein
MKNMISMRFMAASLIACLVASTAGAAALRVSPITLDLKASSPTATVRLWDDGLRPVKVQVRVFRWTKVNGKDRLDPTTDVVASPPITTLKPGTENLIRVVRVSKKPVNGTESYRLLIDQLPDAGRKIPGQINVMIRHSIPVRFTE